MPSTKEVFDRVCDASLQHGLLDQAQVNELYEQLTSCATDEQRQKLMTTLLQQKRASLFAHMQKVAADKLDQAYAADVPDAAKDTGKMPTMKIKGLQSRADLNDQPAQVLKPGNGEERWQVKVLATDECVRIKPANIFVKACRVPAGHGGWQTVELTASEHAAILEQGDRAPVLARCGLELRVQREQCSPWDGRTPRQARLDNQAVTWLMIESNGYAPTPWQGNVGSCIVARAAGDFSDGDFELVNDYCSSLLDHFGEGPVKPRQMSPVAFQRCIANSASNYALNESEAEHAQRMASVSILHIPEGTYDW